MIVIVEVKVEVTGSPTPDRSDHEGFSVRAISVPGSPPFRLDDANARTTPEARGFWRDVTRAALDGRRPKGA